MRYKIIQKVSKKFPFEYVHDVIDTAVKPPKKIKKALSNYYETITICSALNLYDLLYDLLRDGDGDRKLFETIKED